MVLESPELTSFLEGFYGTHADRIRNLIDRYITLYNLPRFEREWEVDAEFLSYCQRVSNFVVVALYNEKKEILVIDSPSQRPQLPGSEGSLRLLGGPIHDRDEQSIEETVNEIVLNNFSVKIVELEPIAFVENTFRHGNERVVHRGIGFAARAHGAIAPKRYMDFHFSGELPDRMLFSNSDVFSKALERIAQKYFSPSIAEVDAGSRPWGRQFFHNQIFKRLLRGASERLRAHISRYVGKPKSILDASCGDDPMILDIAETTGAELVVANDISWSQMESLRANARARRSNIIFSNSNIADLPFHTKFDVALFKNTLHHIGSKEELLAMLKRLWLLSDKLVVVDIEEPRRRFLARLFNIYYEHILGDGADDHHFYTTEEFERLMKLAFGTEAQIKFDHLATVRGLYMLATIDKAAA